MHDTDLYRIAINKVMNQIWLEQQPPGTSAKDLFDSLTGIKPQTYYQRDNHRCGLYLLVNVALFLMMRNEVITKTDVDTKFKDKIRLNDLFHSEVAPQKIDEIRTQMLVLVTDLHRIYKESPRQAPFLLQYPEVTTNSTPPVEAEATTNSTQPVPAKTEVTTNSTPPVEAKATTDSTPPVPFKTEATKPSALSDSASLGPVQTVGTMKFSVKDKKRANANDTKIQRMSKRYLQQLQAESDDVRLRPPVNIEYWHGDQSGGFRTCLKLSNICKIKLYGSRGKQGSTIDGIYAFVEGQWTVIEQARLKKERSHHSVRCGNWLLPQITGFINMGRSGKFCLVQWQQGDKRWLSPKEATEVAGTYLPRKRNAPDRLQPDENGELTCEESKKNRLVSRRTPIGDKACIKFMKEYFYNDEEGKAKAKNEDINRLIENAEFHRAVELAKLLSSSTENEQPIQRLRDAYECKETIPWSEAGAKYRCLAVDKEYDETFIANLVYESLIRKRFSEVLTMENLNCKFKKKRQRAHCKEQGCPTYAHFAHAGYCAKHSKKEKNFCVACKRNEARRKGNLCNKCFRQNISKEEEERLKLCSEGCRFQSIRIGGRCKMCALFPKKYNKNNKKRTIVDGCMFG